MFLELSLFPELAAAISSTGFPEHLGTAAKTLNKCSQFLPVVENNAISGKIIYIDAYKNAITNIDKKLFEETGKGRRFEITIQTNRNKITTINTSYSQSSLGDLLAIFNHINLLEIATYESPAAELLSLNLSSAVRVLFFNEVPKTDNPNLF